MLCAHFVLISYFVVQEDEKVVHLVEKLGPKKWSVIASHLPGRIGKQCRERWHNHLNPDIRKDAWSPEEDALLINLHSRIGNRWAEIAKVLKGRSCLYTLCKLFLPSAL